MLLTDYVMKNYNCHPVILPYYYFENFPEVTEDFVFICSDESYPIPECEAIQFHTSADSPENHMYLDLPLEHVKMLPFSEYTDVPTVGFVGRCPTGYYGFGARLSALNILNRSRNICTDFHVRYEPAGKCHGFWHESLPDYKKNSPLFKTNMLANQYQVCARGNANWSIRFYETLASGRIPVYINTGGKFPLDQEFNKDRVPFVWVDNIMDIESKILKFHATHDLNKVQAECRAFFEMHFTQEAQIRLFDAKYYELRNGSI